MSEMVDKRRKVEAQIEFKKWNDRKRKQEAESKDKDKDKRKQTVEREKRHDKDMDVVLWYSSQRSKIGMIR